MQKRHVPKEVKNPVYCERLSTALEQKGWSARTLQKELKERMPGARAISLTSVRNMAGLGKAPARPRDQIMKAIADLLHVPHPWLMGLTDDPLDTESPMEMLYRAQREGYADFERGVAETFKAYPGLSFVAKAATRDLFVALNIHDAGVRDTETEDGLGVVGRGRSIGRAYTASLEAVGLDPDLIHHHHLSDFVVMTCHGLKAAIR